MSEELTTSEQSPHPRTESASTRRTMSRRGALGLAAATTVAGGAAGLALSRVRDVAANEGEVAGERDTYDFFGSHQAGITTPVQRHLHFASYDLTAGVDGDGLRALLQDWTAAAERLARGLEVGESGAVGGSPLAPPDDTGEALGLEANGLTLTFGVGPGIFDDRFGLAELRPRELAPLPSFAFDLLEEGLSGGDLCIQACANDPQVAVHAIRNLSRIAFGRAQIRWSQLGYGRTSSTSRSQVTPRNLFGFKDGTANITGEDTAGLRDWVWAGADEPSWFTGGSYLVTRRILMLIESWDRVRLQEQEAIIGRNKGEGAPLSGGTEFSALDLGMASTAGGLAIPENAHVRLAHPDANGGARLLRRGYNFVAGNNDLGQLSGGLFFISYQRSLSQFIDVQTSLADDALNEYIRHVGSAVFAVPPGVAAGGFIGEGLFA